MPQQHAISRLRALIADDAHAATFQTLSQYRGWLLERIGQLHADANGGSDDANDPPEPAAGARLHGEAPTETGPAARSG